VPAAKASRVTSRSGSRAKRAACQDATICAPAASTERGQSPSRSCSACGRCSRGGRRVRQRSLSEGSGTSRHGVSPVVDVHAAPSGGPAIGTLPLAAAATPARARCRDLDLHRRRSRGERIRRVGPGIDSFEHRRRNRDCDLRCVHGCLVGHSAVQPGRIQLQPVQPRRRFPAAAPQPRGQRFLRSSSRPGRHNYLLVQLQGRQRKRHDHGTPWLQRRRPSRPAGNAQPPPGPSRLTRIPLGKHDRSFGKRM